jgi:hypothetical protein
MKALKVFRRTLRGWVSFDGETLCPHCWEEMCATHDHIDKDHQDARLIEDLDDKWFVQVTLAGDFYWYISCWECLQKRKPRYVCVKIPTNEIEEVKDLKSR